MTLGTLGGQNALAAQGPQTFTFQGRLLNAAGTAPLTNVVDLTLGIYSPDGLCLLYEESHTAIDLSLTSGMFAVDVGSITTDAKRTANDPVPHLSMSQIFSNSGSQIRAPSANCAAGYTPAAGDARSLRVTVTPQAGVPMTLSPDQVIESVPWAITSETLQGYTPSNFIQVLNNVSQATMTTLTDGSDASALHNHDARYIQSSSNSAQSFGTGGFSSTGGAAVGASAPVAGVKLEVDSTATNTKGIVITGFAGQTVNLFEVKDSGGTVLTSIAPTGLLTAPSVTISGGSPAAGKVLTATDSVGNSSWQFLSTSQFPAPTGDVGGLYSAMSVVKLQGRDIASAAPTGGQVLAWNGSTSKWEPANASTSTQWTNNGADIYFSTGKVGIGTNAPGFPLEVVGAGAFWGNPHAITLKDNSGFTTGYVDVLPSGLNGVGFVPGSGFDAFVVNSSKQGLVVKDSTGYVGIGSSGPAYMLDVVGQVNASGGICIAGTCKTDWTGFESAITAGTGGQYYRGDKTWATLNTAAVVESTNLYYTDARARGAVSASGPLSFNSSTGVFSIPQSSSGADGYLSSTDWSTFNNKLSSTLSSGQIFVGSAGNVATGVTPSGDLSVSPTGIFTLANSGVSANTYTKVTVDSKGRVTSGASLAASDMPAPTGDVGGTYSALSVVKLQGRDLASTAPTGGQVLGYNYSTSKWEPTNNTSSQWTTSGSDIYYSSGNVGIGTATPSAPLEITRTSTATAGTQNLSKSTYTLNPGANSTASSTGQSVNVIANSASNNGNVRGILGYVDLEGNASPTSSLTGVEAYAYNFKGNPAAMTALKATSQSDNGSVTSFKALDLTSELDGGTATNAYGIFISQFTNGAITSRYGIRIDNLGGPGVVTNDFGIYQSSSVQKNYFAGKVGVGITGPGYSLDVQGQINASNGICIAGTCKTDWTGFESAVTAGTGGQYYRGDKTWATLNTAAVAESTNLYYTDARARAAISPTGPLTYNSTTGALGVQAASSVSDGYLTAADWLTFNGKLGTSLSSGQIFVGSAGNVATGVTPSGDLSVSPTGVFTLANSGVSANTYTKVTVDSKGRVTSGASLAASDMPAPTGDVGGTYSAMSVVKLQGRTLSSTAPTGGQILAWNGSTSKWEPTNNTSSQWTTSGSDIYYNTGKVGIGTAPSSQLHVAETRTDLSGQSQMVDYELTVSPTGASTSDFTVSRNMATYSGASSVNSIEGARNGVILGTPVNGASTQARGALNLVYLAHNGATTTTSAVGSYNSLENGGTGTATTGIASYSKVSNDTTGTVANGYASYLTNVKGTGTITNSYGLYIGAIEGTNRYSIYQTDANATNYLAANTTINGTLAVNSLAAATATQLCINGSNVLSACSSSIRYKEDVRPLSMGLDTLLRLEPVTYKWKGRDEYDLGFIAEEVEKVDPLLATHNKNGSIQGVKYSQITAVITNAVKELYEKISTLFIVSDEHAREIASLKSENEKLKARADQFEKENSDLKARMDRLEKLLSAEK